MVDLMMLDSKLQPIKLIDKYISLVWNICDFEAGEFELVLEEFDVPEDFKTTPYFLTLHDSRFDNIMEIQTIYLRDGIAKLKGLSYEHILKHKLLLSDTANGMIDDFAKNGTWENHLSLRELAIRGLKDRDATPFHGDVIPDLQVDGLINSPTTNGYMSPFEGNRTLYEVGRDFRDRWVICGRFVYVGLYETSYIRGHDGHDQKTPLHYITYVPQVLSDSWGVIKANGPVVLFSESLGNLTNTEYIATKQEEATHGVVMYTDTRYTSGERVGTRNYSKLPPKGFTPESYNPLYYSRRSVLIDAKDLKYKSNSLTAAQTNRLQGRVHSKLKNNKFIEMVDGDANDDVFKFGVDYEIGAIVDVISTKNGNLKLPARIRTVTLYSDDSGVKIVPTLDIESRE